MRIGDRLELRDLDVEILDVGDLLAEEDIRVRHARVRGRLQRRRHACDEGLDRRRVAHLSQRRRRVRADRDRRTSERLHERHHQRRIGRGAQSPCALTAHGLRSVAHRVHEERFHFLAGEDAAQRQRSERSTHDDRRPQLARELQLQSRAILGARQFEDRDLTTGRGQAGTEAQQFRACGGLDFGGHFDGRHAHEPAVAEDGQRLGVIRILLEHGVEFGQSLGAEAARGREPSESSTRREVFRVARRSLFAPRAQGLGLQLDAGDGARIDALETATALVFPGAVLPSREDADRLSALQSQDPTQFALVIRDDAGLRGSRCGGDDLADREREGQEGKEFDHVVRGATRGWATSPAALHAKARGVPAHVDG